MRRRAFIALAAGALALPEASRAQQRTMPLIGWVHTGRADRQKHALDGFHAGLAEAGYAEGRNVAIEYRWADEQHERLPQLAQVIAALRPALIAAVGGGTSASAARAVTTTTPILFIMGADPVEAGVVASFNRPGGNLTGITVMTGPMTGKLVEVMDQLAPRHRPLATLMSARTGAYEEASAEAAAKSLGRSLVTLRVRSESEFEGAFATMSRHGVGGVVVGADALFSHHAALLAGLAARHGIVAGRFYRDLPLAGGFFSYGPDVGGAYRQIGLYAGKILGGADPAVLPVLQPTQFDFVINLRTARALGIDIPPALLARADEVIE